MGGWVENILSHDADLWADNFGFSINSCATSRLSTASIIGSPEILRNAEAKA